MADHMRKKDERSWVVTIEVAQDKGGRRARRQRVIQGTRKDAEHALKRMQLERDNA